MSVPINDLNNFKRHNEDIGLTDKNAIILAVNRGLNPGAGVQKMSFQQEKKPFFFHEKFFEYFTAIILRLLLLIIVQIFFK